MTISLRALLPHWRRRTTSAPTRRRRRQRPVQFEPLESRHMLSVMGDFNGDGFMDLAIGIPLKDVGIIVDAGVVHVIYGTAQGLNTTTTTPQ